MEEFNLDPNRIFNIDETGFSTIQTQKETVLAQKGVKRIGHVVSAKRVNTITAICCISATGIFCSIYVDVSSQDNQCTKQTFS